MQVQVWLRLGFGSCLLKSWWQLLVVAFVSGWLSVVCWSPSYWAEKSAQVHTLKKTETKFKPLCCMACLVDPINTTCTVKS